MSIQQLETLINLLKSSPSLSNVDVAQMRAGAEQMDQL